LLERCCLSPYCAHATGGGCTCAQAGNDLKQGGRTLRVWEALRASELQEDRLSWSQAIKAYGLAGRAREGLAEFRTMLKGPVKPDTYCFSACITA